MRQVKIANHLVGEGHPPFIVAEAGINHNGNLDQAFKMIEVAKVAGANAIKFQTFKTEEFVGDRQQLFTYRSQGQEVTESMFEMFKQREFSPDEWMQIKRYCDETGILFLATPFSPAGLTFLLELGVPAIKVASGDFTDLPLLRNYASTGLPIIVSCGMADLAEVYQALAAIGTLDGYPTVLLLCTSEYPTPPADVNLLKLKTLGQAFPNVVLGLSDHTQGSLASSLAVALGGCVFEKHFTLSHDLPGPDHWFSEDPVGLQEWITSIRTAHIMMGESIVRPTAAELEMRVLARRSIVALRDIQPQEALTLENIGLRRPGNGLPSTLLDQVLGLQAVRPIRQGDVLSLGDFS